MPKIAGRVRVEGNKIIVSYDQVEVEEFDIPGTLRLIVKNNEKVEAGQALTEGSLESTYNFEASKAEKPARYIYLSEIQNVYRAQGQNINDKHFEVIVTKMMNKVQIVKPGDSDLLPNDMVDRIEIRQLNEELMAEGKQPATIC